MIRLIHPFLFFFLLLDLEASWSSERESKKRSHEENPGKSSNEKSKKQKTDLEKLAEKPIASENLFPKSFRYKDDMFVLERGEAIRGNRYNRPTIYWINDRNGEKDYQKPHLTISEGKPGDPFLQMHVTFGRDSNSTPSVEGEYRDGKLQTPQLKRNATSEQLNMAGGIFVSFLQASGIKGSAKKQSKS